MTSQQREHLRAAIDQAQRARIATQRKAYPGHSCAGCGTHHDNYTNDCPTCTDRRNRRAKDARRRELQQEHNLRLELRRNRQCTRCGRPVDDPTPIPKSVCVNCWDRQRQRRYKAR